MHIQIACPSASTNVQVTGTGSGTQGTICVKGTYADTFQLPFLQLLIALFKAFLRWLRSIFKPKPTNSALTTSNKIRVHVVNRGDTPPKETDPGSDFSPPALNWCIRNVPVPNWSATGSPLTLYAWLLDAHDGILDGPHTLDFIGGGSSPKDCCSGCGFVQHHSPFATELASPARLEVNIQDGPNAGHHLAKSVSHLTWEANIRGMMYRISGDTGSALVIQSPSSSATSRVIESSPFSAIFPGMLFGAARDVVVTKA